MSGLCIGDIKIIFFFFKQKTAYEMRISYCVSDVCSSGRVEAYLRRIGLEQAPRPDQEGLMSVQRAHRWAIPFENFDIPLGRGISLDPAAVFDKLVVRRRGGYCFEQNQLFLRALLQLGFDARPLL